MKTKQTICITRLFGLLLLATGLSTGACTSEMTDHEVTPPTEIDTGRREVLLTFQERFAYRADGYGPLPYRAQQLPLAVDQFDDSKTTGLLGLQKGLYVKLLSTTSRDYAINARCVMKRY